MIRLTFKPNHVAPILEGRKTMTQRWRPVRGIKEGMLVAAVTRDGKRPAFLVPASQRFALLRVTKVSTIDLYEITLEDANACGFTAVDVAVAFYEATRTDPEDRTLYRYAFTLADPSHDLAFQVMEVGPRGGLKKGNVVAVKTKLIEADQ